jgi:hypothetical protein
MVLDGGNAPAALHLAHRWRRLDDGGLEALEQWLDEHPNTSTVIIDTFARVRARRGKNPNVYQEDYGDLLGLHALASARGIAIIVVHHVRKGRAEDWLEDVSGSTGLTGAADTIAVLRRSRAQADAVLHLTGRDIEEAEVALNFDAPRGSWTLLGDAAAWQLTKERAEVLSAVRDAEGAVGPKEVAELLGKSEATVRQLMARMAKADQLRKLDRGKYVMPTSHGSHDGHDDDEGHDNHSDNVSDATGVTAVTDVTAQPHAERDDGDRLTRAGLSDLEPSGPCARCGRDTGLQDDAGAWRCGRCRVDEMSEDE